MENGAKNHESAVTANGETKNTHSYIIEKW